MFNNASLSVWCDPQHRGVPVSQTAWQLRGAERPGAGKGTCPHITEGRGPLGSRFSLQQGLPWRSEGPATSPGAAARKEALSPFHPPAENDLNAHVTLGVVLKKQLVHSHWPHPID